MSSVRVLCFVVVADPSGGQCHETQETVCRTQSVLVTGPAWGAAHRVSSNKQTNKLTTYPVSSVSELSTNLLQYDRDRYRLVIVVFGLLQLWAAGRHELIITSPLPSG